MGKSRIIASNSDTFINSFIRKLLDEMQLDITNICDFITIAPDKKRASMGIDQMRQLRQWAILKPFSSQHKLAVIKSADLLTTEAQNSILKLLEEPNTCTHLVLITNNHHKLLPTILSRCELVTGHSATRTDILEYRMNNKTALEKFSMISELISIKDKTEQRREIYRFLESTLNENRAGLQEATDIRKSIQNIETIQETIKMIDKRVSLHLALENLIINYVS